MYESLHWRLFGSVIDSNLKSNVQPTADWKHLQESKHLLLGARHYQGILERDRL